MPTPSYTAFAHIPDWGRFGVTVTPQGLTHVWWAASAPPVAANIADATMMQALRCAASQWLRHLREYFNGQRRAFPLEIAWETLPVFQRAVLQATVAIPYGETWTYGQIAAMVGKPTAARAVGRALATNPMPIVIPCHRVQSADGRLHGFSGPGGTETKARLLALERRSTATLPRE